MRRLFALLAILSVPSVAYSQKPTVFITDGDGLKAQEEQPSPVEVLKVFSDQCPQVTVMLYARSNYTVLVERRGLIWIEHTALVFDGEGRLIFATSSSSLESVAASSCAEIATNDKFTKVLSEPSPPPGFVLEKLPERFPHSLLPSEAGKGDVFDRVAVDHSETVASFAARIKKRFPQFKEFDDDRVVREVLWRYPVYESVLKEEELRRVYGERR